MTIEVAIVDCLKIIEDKSSENRVYTPDARLIIATRKMPRRRAWSSRLNISTVPRREGWNPRPSCSVTTKTWLEARVLISVQYQDVRAWSPRLDITTVSRRRAWSPRLVEFETRVQQDSKSTKKCEAQSPRLGYNCPHYWVNYCLHNERVNPHCGVFLGDSFTP